ncbi:cupin domain-containing protein [Effusibacillus consociatus]|uniref:Cupin domain-containing protein n=1 Tax=Effusibacillus consociatus TaxID=1117041 RepID=A0ABV9Q1I9_9BACL
MAEITKTEGHNYTAVETGRLENWDQHVIEMSGGRKARGKLFLKEVLALNGMEVSLNKLPAGAAVPFYHQHRENEELYIFIKGTGQFQVDGQVLEVQEGTVIRVVPKGIRTWRNNSTEDLYYIVIQAAENSLNAWTRTDGVISDQPVVWPE